MKEQGLKENELKFCGNKTSIFIKSLLFIKSKSYFKKKSSISLLVMKSNIVSLFQKKKKIENHFNHKSDENVVIH